MSLNFNHGLYSVSDCVPLPERKVFFPSVLVSYSEDIIALSEHQTEINSVLLYTLA